MEKTQVPVHRNYVGFQWSAGNPVLDKIDRLLENEDREVGDLQEIIELLGHELDELESGEYRSLPRLHTGITNFDQKDLLRYSRAIAIGVQMKVPFADKLFISLKSLEDKWPPMCSLHCREMGDLSRFWTVFRTLDKKQDTTLIDQTFEVAYVE